MAITDKDMATCYDMSLKDFEHSGVHDLFKVCDLLFFLCISCPFNLCLCILSNKI